jgi:hypothetical protein
MMYILNKNKRKFTARGVASRAQAIDESLFPPLGEELLTTTGFKKIKIESTVLLLQKRR